MYLNGYIIHIHLDIKLNGYYNKILVKNSKLYYTIELTTNYIYLK